MACRILVFIHIWCHTSGMKVYPENKGMIFIGNHIEQLTRISFWAFTLILTFSHQGRRNSDSSLRTEWRGNLL